MTKGSFLFPAFSSFMTVRRLCPEHGQPMRYVRPGPTRRAQCAQCAQTKRSVGEREVARILSRWRDERR